MTCLRYNVLNAVVLVQPAWTAADVVLLYGFRLFGPACRAISVPELLDRYEGGRLRKRGQLFGRLLGSFYGCPLNVSWYPLPPYAMFVGDSDDPRQRLETWRLTGVDGELIKMLAKIFQFKLHLLPPCEKKSSAMRMNDSIDECFEQLASNNSSVVIGAMSASHLYRDKFSTTDAYHQSALVFVVRVDRFLGSVNQLVQPFCSLVWLALILSCLSLLLLQWLWRRRNERIDVIAGALQVHTTLLGNPLETYALPRASPVRFCLGAWLLLALVQRVAYQGKLYDVFRLPYYSPVPEHIGQLLEQHYQYVYFDYADYFPANRTLLRRWNIMDRFQQLETAEEGSRLTTTALMGNLAYYKHNNWQHSRLTYVREHIYLYQLVMYLHRHSMLKFGFDRKLKQLQSAGIVGYINRFFERRLYHAPYAQPSHEVSAVPLEVFCGLFYVCHLMLSAALFVFVLELISQRVIWLRRYFD